MGAGVMDATGRKAIVLLADGTGNSAGKLSKTNVWRLYQALDLAPPTPGESNKGAVLQIAYYHDGVGTSSFKPLALLGGAFGWGLKRNVLDLYTFLCRNYQPGDAIYAFGFSRGAFTIRVLVGLVVDQGLLRCSSDGKLVTHARDAYRGYRRHFDQAGRLVAIFRCIRDSIIAGWRRVAPRESDATIETVRVEQIAFVGVWDTVSAYGTPIDELTRGIDRWIWPLSLPNYKLSEKVDKARHALSLDDERDTFRPLLWDEVHEKSLVEEELIKPDRLRQVWFAGVHSDLGGGYPDDALAYVALDWMMEEAGPLMEKSGRVGLRFKPEAVVDVKRAISISAPMHDSRKGLAGYYRYQPRKISSMIEPPDETALVMRDPALRGHGWLKSVRIHESVFRRIEAGVDRYAPIVLPDAYEIVRPDGSVLQNAEHDVRLRAARQEWIWNDVWRKRVNYFMMVGFSVFAVLLPAIVPPTACEGPQCLLAPFISAAGAFLPGFAEPWITAFAQRPGLLLIVAGTIAFLLWRSANLQARIHEGMREVWGSSLRLPGVSSVTAAGKATVRPCDLVYRLRTNYVYERTFQILKWRFVPTGFAWILLLIGLLLIPAVAANRVFLVWAERANVLCTERSTNPEFATSSLCWPKGDVVKGELYRIELTVTQPWVDGTIDASPVGFGSERLPWYLRYYALFARRSLYDRWFQPLIKIVAKDGPDFIKALDMHIQPLEMQRSDTQASLYTAQFTAARSGKLFLFVNDAIIVLPGQTRRFYDNNKGAAAVSVERVR
jgi:uncharacterized protein (DUF2235 family)